MDVWYHTDGHINDIFGDLIEIGVNVINSQVKVVGLDWIAANVRGKVAFRTDIDRQHVMPFGSPSEVKEEVHRVFEACGTPDGGLIACGEVRPGRAAGEHPGDVRGVPGVRDVSLNGRVLITHLTVRSGRPRIGTSMLRSSLSWIPRRQQVMGRRAAALASRMLHCYRTTVLCLTSGLGYSPHRFTNDVDGAPAVALLHAARPSVGWQVLADQRDDSTRR